MTIYFDANATMPIKPAVVDLVAQVMRETGNASSVHNLGRKARADVEKARDQLAVATNSDSANVIFNSGATESLNTVLKSFGETKVWRSAVEHPAGREPAMKAIIIPVTSDGLIDLHELKNMLESNDKPELISVMYVNNETGVIQPITELSALTKKHGIKLHVDAAQALGRVKIDIKELGADYLSLSSHKCGGPQGVGALILGPCTEAPRLLCGGGQEKNRRAGTVNTAGIAGFGLAAELAIKDFDAFQKLGSQRDTLETGLKEISPEVKIWGEKAPRVPNTTTFTLNGVPATTTLMNFDMAGICVSSGSACSSGSSKGSTVLMAMGASEEESKCSIRLSQSWQTSENDIQRFLEEWSKIYDRVKHKVAA